ncbi:radical SAM/SPASM domain-containing protein [Rhizobium redzepovicii]|uniref:radical SAM/SPASM domain-containing protein n=1 Tax=Rhizobium redzepovicii TaxID=2867518 RepID=UPI001C933252|nr:radical SAM protein [Rhizobium redzepovicii]MBY4616150.1 SPASM domain-containing protein [Rhizobium redzepovicii]
MAQYTLSNYNFFTHRSNACVVYNARTGSFVSITNQLAAALQRGDDIDDAELPPLYDAGVLTRGDELQEITARYVGNRADNRVLHVTLVPTLGCNRACSYCYQDEYRVDGGMSADVQSATVDFIAAQLDRGKFTELSCTWYGGEPLRCKEAVIYLGERLNRLALDRAIHLKPMRIVTNGALLSENTARKLSEIGFNLAQISFDALIDDGWSKRGVLKPDRTPSLILRNVIAARNWLDIQIRINLTKENKGDSSEILECLKTYGLAEISHFARVSDYEGEAKVKVDNHGHRFKPDDGGVVTESHNVVSRKDFAEFELKHLLQEPVDLRKISQRLTPKTQFCSATSGNMYVVDPEGFVSRCWLSAGAKSEALGNVLEWVESRLTENNSTVWTNFAPFTYKSCSSCKVLPLCMGGCSHPRINMNATKPPCEAIKFQIESYVEYIGQRLSFD